jgi:hypothetical protein
MRGLALSALLVGAMSAGCRKEKPPQSRQVTDCLTSIDHALEATTMADVTKAYYGGCAEVFTQPACKDAWKAAATAPTDKQLGMIATACRKTYCPDLEAYSLAICRDDFEATPDALERDWPPLFAAMLSRETPSSVPDMQSPLFTLYVKMKTVETAEKAMAAQPLVKDGGAPVPSATGVAPAASSAASAAPAASAKPTAKESASTKTKPGPSATPPAHLAKPAK